MLQRHPIQKLHGDEGLAVCFADFVDRADVGMVQGGSSMSFTPKTFQVLAGLWQRRRAGTSARQNDLVGVFGLVDHAHTATAELLDDAVVRDGLADHWRGTPILVGSNLRRVDWLSQSRPWLNTAP